MNTSFNFKRVLLLGLSSIFFLPKNLHSIYGMFAEALCATVGRELDVEGFAGDVLVLGDDFKMVPVSKINKYSYLARYDEYLSESVTDVKTTFTTKVIKLVIKVKDYFETLIVGADQEFLVWDSSYKTSDLLDNSTNASSSYVKAKDLRPNSFFVTSAKTACCLYSWSQKTDDTYEMYRIYSGKKSLKYIEVGKSLLRAKLPQLPDPGYGKYCSNIQIPLLSFSFGGAAMAFTAVTPLTFGLNIATSILTNVVAYQINLSQNDADTLRKVTTKQIHSSFGAEFEFSGDLNYCQQEQLHQREIEKREEEQKIIDKALAEKVQQKEKPKDLPSDLKESLLKNLADQKIDFAQISGLIIGQDFYKTKVLFKNQFNELESHLFKTDEDSFDKTLPKKDCCVTVSTSTKGPEIDIEYLPAEKSQSILTIVMFDSFEVKETVHNYQPIPIKINANPEAQDESLPKNKLKKDATILNSIAFYLNQYFFKNDFFDCSEFVEQETAEELKIRLDEMRQREEERIAEHNRVERLRDEALEKAREQLRFDIKKKKEAEEKLKKLDQEKKDEAEKLKKLNEEKKEQEKEKQESCFFAELKNLSITSCSIAAFATLKTCFKFLKSRKLFSAATLFAIKKVPKLAGAIIVLEQLWPYLTDGYEIAKDYKDFSEVGEFYLKRTSHEKSSDDVFDKLDEFSKKYFTEQQKLELTLEKIMSKNDTSTEDLVDQLTIAFQEFTESTSEKILIKIDQTKDEVILKVNETKEEVINRSNIVVEKIDKLKREESNYFKNMFEAGAAKAEQSAAETSKLIAIICEKDSSARDKDLIIQNKDKIIEVERKSNRKKDKAIEQKDKAIEQERAAKEQERAAKEKLEKYLRSIGVDPDTI